MKKELPSIETMCNAFLKKDPSYDGIFYVAVKTTGVFCRPICTARKPKLDNIEFFPSVIEAISNGYRACKVCNPLNLNGGIPLWIKELLIKIQAAPTARWKDSDLRKLGFEPNRVRRWFKKNYNTTFLSYLRSIRLGTAINQIGNGDKIMETAYTTGFESLSGFTDALKNLTGKSPVKSKNMKVFSIDKIQTPLGQMLAGAINDKLCMLEFEDRRMLKTQIKRITKTHKAVPIFQKYELFKKVEEQIKLYFDGKLKDFSLPLAVTGTEFQKRIWNELLKIPYGKTICYEELAERIGNPSAVRAVASANGYNSIAIIIPCHRVIGKDGNLRGYGGKVWRKKRLLELENHES